MSELTQPGVVAELKCRLTELLYMCCLRSISGCYTRLKTQRASGRLIGECGDRLISLPLLGYGQHLAESSSPGNGDILGFFWFYSASTKPPAKSRKGIFGWFLRL